MSFDGYVNLSGILFITGGLNVIGGILVILLMGVIGTGWNTVVPEFLTVISVLGLTLITGLFMIKGFKNTPEASANCSARGIRAGSVVMLSRTFHAPVRIVNLPWRCPPLPTVSSPGSPWLRRTPLRPRGSHPTTVLGKRKILGPSRTAGRPAPRGTLSQTSRDLLRMGLSRARRQECRSRQRNGRTKTRHAWVTSSGTRGWTRSCQYRVVLLQLRSRPFGGT